MLHDAEMATTEIRKQRAALDRRRCPRSACRCPQGAFTLITQAQAIPYDREGLLLIEELFSPEEVAVLLDAVERETRIAKHSLELKDTGGRDGEPDRRASERRVRQRPGGKP
jgi:hypothetical protein